MKSLKCRGMSPLAEAGVLLVHDLEGGGRGKQEVRGWGGEKKEKPSFLRDVLHVLPSLPEAAWRLAELALHSSVEDSYHSNTWTYSKVETSKSGEVLYDIFVCF